jgi:hypothetical protein
MTLGLKPPDLHLAGIRACVNLVENYVLQAYWTHGEAAYPFLVDILDKCVNDLNEVALKDAESLRDAVTARTFAKPAETARIALRMSPEGDCPDGTRPVDNMCVPA